MDGGCSREAAEFCLVFHMPPAEHITQVEAGTMTQ
jgi:hypothetical protein